MRSRRSTVVVFVAVAALWFAAGMGFMLGLGSDAKWLLAPMITAALIHAIVITTALVLVRRVRDHHAASKAT